MVMLRRCAAAATLALLAACGGGDGGDDGRVDVAAAWRNLLAISASYTVTGRGSDGADYALTIALAPAGSGAYPLTGQLGARSTRTVTLVQNGVSLGTSTATLFYDAASAAYIGGADSGGACETATANGVLPTFALPGSSGVLYAATTFDRCSAGALVTGSVNNTWSIETEAGLVFFCTNGAFRDALGNDTGSEQQCYEAGAGGALGTRARVAVVVPNGAGSFTLVARNY